VKTIFLIAAALLLRIFLFGIDISVFAISFTVGVVCVSKTLHLQFPSHLLWSPSHVSQRISCFNHP
jgi:ribose/xylose/arabinose/galactoside ABC-type transport system permease subunit